MISVRQMLAGGVLAAGLIAGTQSAHAQSNIEPKGTSADTGATSYTKDQIVTATVHQAWILSGKDESKFFDIVQQLAQISASNRGITLPDSEAAGRRMGNYIKTSAKSDTDQLLYAVVDKAVLMTSKMPVHKAGTPATK